MCQSSKVLPPSTAEAPPCVPDLLDRSGVGLERRGLTVQNALEVVVGLDLGQVIADKLVVDLVLDVGQQNEGSNNTLAAATLHLALDIPVPDIVVIGDKSAPGIVGHPHEEITVLDLRVAAVHPILCRRITQVLGVRDEIVQAIPGVLLIEADGLGGAGVERVGIERVTAAQTVSASAAFAVFCRCELCAWRWRGDSRPQQGLSSGHLEPSLHFGASARTGERERAAKRREESSMMEGVCTNEGMLYRRKKERKKEKERQEREG